MKKSTLLMVLSLVLALTVGLGTTLAYLTDTDADVNVMTLGNVDILQNEQQWNEDKTELEEFENDKPLYPYVGTLSWTNTGYENGAYRQFDVENAVDKYVTVTNTGKSPAYVRTLIALEMGQYENLQDFAKSGIGLSINKENGDEFDFPGTWVWHSDEDFMVEIDGKLYNVMVAEHQEPVEPGETTIPSLLQIYLNKTADNEEVEMLDGNGNGKYDILVLSQAVQTAGFEDAHTALHEAFPFGENFANVPGWFTDWDEDDIGSPGDEWPNNNPPSIPEGATVVSSWDELKAALNNKDEQIYLEPGIYRVNNIGGTEKYSVPAGTTIFGMGDVMIEGMLTSTLQDVTFEGIKFSASNSMRWAYPKGEVVFKNCEFDGYGVYAIHFDTTNGNILFEDCDIKGWVAMGTGTGHVTFDGCTLIGNGSYGLIRSYVDTDIKDTTFDVSAVNTTDVYQDGMHAIGCTFEVTNCTNVNGTMEELVNVSKNDAGIDGVINIK